MKLSCVRRRVGVVLTMLALGATAHAAEPTKPATTATPAAPSSAVAPASPASAKISEEVTRRLPKYDPTAAAAAEKPVATAEGAQPLPPGEMSEETLHLPNMQVTKDQPLRGKERELRNPKERLDRALKANPGLKIGPFSKMNNAIALEMARESREAAARARLAEHVEGLPATDEERAKEELRLMRAAIARPNTDWQTTRR